MAQHPVVFDKAKAHLDSVRALGLDDHQAYVHAGLFFGWAVARGLVAPWVERGAEEAFAAFRAGALTGPDLLYAVDGALIDDQFTDEGLAFVATYYDPRTGAFVGDYLRTLCAGLPSEFHVEDSRANAETLGAVLDERFAAWRASWDAARGRPDLRSDRGPAPRDGLPATFVAPVIPITSGIPLPHGPLGIRAGRAGTVRAVERALGADRRVVLAPVAGLANRVEPTADHVGAFGVVAELDTVTDADDRPGAKDVLLQCVARVELTGWRDRDALIALVALLPEPEPTDDDLAAIDTIRHRIADVARRRAERHEPPGLLALGAVLEPAALLDVVARELLATRSELATVLEAPDLATRIEVVTALIEREG